MSEMVAGMVGPEPCTERAEGDVFDDLALVVARQKSDAARRLALIVQACDEHDVVEDDLRDDDAAPDAALGWEGAERWVRVGADGTPWVAEFLTVELAGLLGCTVLGARARIAEALNLRHRHPRLWEAVQAVRVEAWQAQQVVTECLRAGLGAQECLQVDDWLVDGIDLLGWPRARRLLKGLIVRVDPVLAAERVAARRQQRGVWVSTIEEGQVSVEGRLDAVDGLALEAQVSRIATLLAGEATAAGEIPEPLQHRRARALAMLAVPHLAAAYLEDHGQPASALEEVLSPVPRIDPDKLRPQVKLHLHLHADDVSRADADGVVPAGSGVVRIERHGPVDIDSLHHVLRGSVVKVQPVIDLNAPPVTDAYEVPTRLREHVIARNPYDLMPWSATESRRCDLDHTVAFDHRDRVGRHQTRADNLGPLARTAHRAKTHAGHRWEQLRPGVFWFTSEAGFQYLVTPQGTMPMGRDPGAARSAPPELAQAAGERRRPVTPMREGPARPQPGWNDPPPF